MRFVTEMLLKRSKVEMALTKLRKKATKTGIDKLTTTDVDKEIKSARKAKVR